MDRSNASFRPLLVVLSSHLITNKHDDLVLVLRERAAPPVQPRRSKKSTASLFGARRCIPSNTIAAFDDCGGHINLHAGYHYHAATGCGTSVAQPDGHAKLIGYAMDGYGIYAMTDEAKVEPTDLDTCRGHTDATRGYHYHAASAGENMFIGCFHGEQGTSQ